MSVADVTVTIAQWGKTDLTRRAIESLAQSDYEGSIQILVYDNDSPGGSGGIENMDGVELIQGPENIGFGPAHDALSTRATGTYLIIMNNDIVVTPSAVRRLVERLESDTAIGAVAPSYRNFDGSQLEQGGFIGGSGDGFQLFRLARPPESVRRMPANAHYGSAAFLLLRTEDFVSRGGFDDLFAPAYYEDTDLCAQLASEGKRTVVEPTAVVFHYEGATAGRETSSGFKRHQPANRVKFVNKWKQMLAGRPPVSFEYAFTESLFPGTAPRVLWAAPHLPRADREAGYARVVRMLEALKDNGVQVGYWAEHGHDMDRYGPMLEAMGIPWFADHRPARWPLSVAQPTTLTSFEDLVEAAPWAAIIVSFPELADRLLSVARASAGRTPVIVDDVDLHFLRLERAAAAGVNVPGQLHIAKETELAIYARSDGVIAASDVEQEVLEHEIRGLPVFTFPVAAEAIASSENSARPEGRAIFLGNMVHEPNRDAVEWWIDEISEQCETRTVLRVVGSGSTRHAEDWGRSDRVDVAGWVEHLEDEFRGGRLFVAPIRYGAGTKGKLMTAVRFGLPIVTTSIGAEGYPESFGACLVVADEPAEFALAVDRLMSDDGEWMERSAAAFRLAGEMFESQRALATDFADWVARRGRMFPRGAPQT